MEMNTFEDIVELLFLCLFLNAFLFTSVLKHLQPDFSVQCCSRGLTAKVPEFLLNIQCLEKRSELEWLNKISIAIYWRVVDICNITVC